MLPYILAHPDSRTVRRYVRAVGSFKRLVLMLLLRRPNSRWLLNRYAWKYEWLVRLLLARGYREISSDYQSPLFRASFAGNVKLCLLLTAANFPTVNNRGKSILYNCLRCTVGYGTLLKVGLDPNGKKYLNDFHFLLHTHAFVANITRLRQHLDAGADPNLRTMENATPLHWAVMRDNRIEIMQVLVDAGADVDAETDEGETAIQIAARYGYFRNVEFLQGR